MVGVLIIAAACRPLHVPGVRGLDGVPSLSTSGPRLIVPDTLGSVAGCQGTPIGGVVVDRNPQGIYSVDFADGVAIERGRSGDGPTEYRSIGGLFPFRADSLLLEDPAARSVLVLAPDGTPVRKLAFGQMGAGLTLAGGDETGAVYLTQRTSLGTERAPAESLVVYRWSPPAGVLVRAVTLATSGDLTLTQVEAVGAHGQSRISMSIPNPFGWNDVVIPQPSGGVLVLRAHGMTLERWVDGRLVRSSPPWGYDPLPLATSDFGNGVVPAAFVPVLAKDATKSPFNATRVIAGRGFLGIPLTQLTRDSSTIVLEMDTLGVVRGQLTIPHAERACMLDGTQLWTTMRDSFGVASLWSRALR